MEAKSRVIEDGFVAAGKNTGGAVEMSREPGQKDVGDASKVAAGARIVKDEVACDSIVDGGGAAEKGVAPDADAGDATKCWKYELNVPNGAETRLHKIPKDVLRRYGIVVEDADDWRELPEPEPDPGIDGDANPDDEEDEDEDEDGKLVIDMKTMCEEGEGVGVGMGVGDGLAAKDADFSAFGNHFMIANVKSLKDKLKCNICQEPLPDLESLEDHKRQHCTFHGCLDLIEDESEREKHLQIHEAHPLKPFRCEFCKKRFYYYRFSKRHSDNCKHVKRSKCPYCRFSFTKVSLYNKHVAMHLTKITCIDCNKTYIQPKKYNRHLYMHHRKQVIYQCPECPRRFQLQENMMRHIKLHDLHVSKAGLLPFIQVQDLN